jgi:branched-chain amino acid transport system ATP-binding protein
VKDLTIRCGPFLAVDGVGVEVAGGEIVGFIGPNGAGKSSVVKAIGGLVQPQSGSIAFAGEDLSAVPSHERIRRGISVVPEGRGLFPRMSVEENLMMGGYTIGAARMKEPMERCLEMFPILAKRRHQIAGTLSGGQQQMLAISVGLMSLPQLFVLDKPSRRLAPIVIGEIAQGTAHAEGSWPDGSPVRAERKTDRVHLRSHLHRGQRVRSVA